MFSERIGQTALTSDDANALFENAIPRTIVEEDVTLCSTIRAIIFPKMSEGEKLLIRRRSFSPFDGVADWFATPGGSFTYAYPNTRSNWEEFKNKKADFCSCNGLTEDEQVSAFFDSQKANIGGVAFFFNQERKCSVLVVQRNATAVLHAVQCAIMAYFPWYFPRDYKPSEMEMAVCNALTKTDKNAYIDAIAKIAEQYDFATAKIKRLLEGYDTFWLEEKRKACSDNVDYLMNCITDNKRMIASYLKKIRENHIEAMGLTAAITEAKGRPSEVQALFLKNKDRLILEKVEDGNITFIAKGYLEFFDEDLAARVLENKYSFLYEYDFPDDEIATIFRHIFIEQDVRMKFCAAYRISRSECEGVRNYCSNNAKVSGFFPNPHINRYECLGDYESAIIDMITEGDISGAVQQCLASCSSLNLSDGAVMDKFMDYLEDSRELKCFELPDGTTMSYNDLVKHFEEEIHSASEEDSETEDASANETPSEDNVGTEEEEINGEENQDNTGNG